MTEFNKFLKIKEIVSSSLPLKIKWDKRRKDIYPNGYYFYDPKRIHVYSKDDREEKNLSLVSSIILHEYGHYIFDVAGTAFDFDDDYEFEKTIWNVAEYLVVPEILPRNFHLFRDYCLETYYD